jgi:hypothetical protein
LIVSFVLFRKSVCTDAGKYLVGMISNIEAILLHCPSARIWIYHDDSISSDWLEILEIAKHGSGLDIDLKYFSSPDF